MPTKCQEIALESASSQHTDREINDSCTVGFRTNLKQKRSFERASHITPVGGLRTRQESPGRLSAQRWVHAAGLTNMPAGSRRSDVRAPCCCVCQRVTATGGGHVNARRVTGVTSS